MWHAPAPRSPEPQQPQQPQQPPRWPGDADTLPPVPVAPGMPVPPQGPGQPGQPGQPPKKRRIPTLGWIAIVVVGLVVLSCGALVGLTALANLGTQSNAPTTQQQQQQQQQQKQQQPTSPPATKAPTQAAPTPTPPPPTPVPTQVPKPKSWVTTQTFSGTQNTKTPSFDIADGARIVWTASPTDQYGGYFGVTAYNDDGSYADLIANTSLDKAESGTYNVHVAGGGTAKIYLDVSTVGANYTVKVQEYR